MDIDSTFSLLSLGSYLLPQTTLNRYLSRHSSKNSLLIDVFLVTLPILGFVMIIMLLDPRNHFTASIEDWSLFQSQADRARYQVD